MGEDNSLEINIQAIDDASEVLLGVVDTAAEMANGINTAAEEMNASLGSIGVAATDMSAGIEGSIAAVDESLATLDESAAAAGETVAASMTDMVSTVGADSEGFIASMDELAAVMGVDSEAISEEAIAVGVSFTDAAAIVLDDNVAMQASMENTTGGTALLGAALLLLSQQLNRAAGSVRGEINNAAESTTKWNIALAATQQTLTDTGSSIPLSQVREFAAEMQKTTLFQQGQTLGAAEQILTFKDLQPRYKEIIGLAADLATKQGVLTGTTPPLAQAARTLSDALENPINGLGRLMALGVAVPPAMQDAFKKMAKNGDIAADQTALLNILNKSIGGLSVTAANTAGTGMQKLHNNFVSMQQDMPGITQAMDTFAGTLNKILIPLAAFVDAHPKLTAYILIATASVLGILAALTALAAQFIILSIALAPILPYIMPIITAIGVGLTGAIAAVSWPLLLLIGLIVVLAALWITKWNDIKGGAEIVFNWLKEGVKNVTDTFKNAWTAVIDYVSDLFLSWYNKIAGWIDQIINKMNQIASSVGGAIKSASGAVGNVVHSVGNAILSVLPHFAEGGIVNGAQLAMVGEAGPEMIIPMSMIGGGHSSPLPSFGGFGGGGMQPINVYISGAIYSTEDQAKQLGDAFARQINRQLKLSGYR